MWAGKGVSGVDATRDPERWTVTVSKRSPQVDPHRANQELMIGWSSMEIGRTRTGRPDAGFLMRTWQVAMNVQNRTGQPDGSSPMRNCRSSGKARPRLERGSMMRNGKTSRRPDRTGRVDGGSTMREQQEFRKAGPGLVSQMVAPWWGTARAGLVDQEQ